MSLESWKKEFYPVDVDKVPPGRAAIEHSLQKWKGLRQENRGKHNGYMSNYLYVRFDPKYFEVGDDSCSLCHHYYDEENLANPCLACPLAKSTKPCDDDFSPWQYWAENHDPEPMISALEKTLSEFKDGDD